ncbi:DDE-type integrase/transposase/recombinase [Halalkalibacter urbisdiaboli]|uniref:DDE-type integrase/transposase/recombinase n=1 Tax=Halalkalibacter urbisdiaboli TaxID=1960589 RepID=UPI000B444CAB|nr:DDE-type integrase/transposase/recombinase [Halalkalibacter urbisdiaboli]
MIILLQNIDHFHYFLKHKKDLFIASHLPSSLEMELVYQTLDKLVEATVHFHPEAILHSDQGVHYTNPIFQEKGKELGIRQSMSRKGNCWDNSPMELFFGQFKEHVNYKSSKILQN